MADGWAVGFATMWLIFFGAISFACLVIGQRPPSQKEDTKPDYKAILRDQAKAAERRQLIRADIPTWDEWLHHAARRLQHWWPTVSYDEARTMIRDYMSDIATYPDPSFDWSLSAAEDVADDYMREFGESHGANS